MKRPFFLFSSILSLLMQRDHGSVVAVAHAGKALLEFLDDLGSSIQWLFPFSSAARKRSSTLFPAASSVRTHTHTFTYNLSRTRQTIPPTHTPAFIVIAVYCSEQFFLIFTRPLYLRLYILETNIINREVFLHSYCTRSHNLLMLCVCHITYTSRTSSEIKLKQEALFASYSLRTFLYVSRRKIKSKQWIQNGFCVCIMFCTEFSFKKLHSKQMI